MKSKKYNDEFFLLFGFFFCIKNFLKDKYIQKYFYGFPITNNTIIY